MKTWGFIVFILTTIYQSPVSRGGNHEPERQGIKLSEWIHRLDSPDVSVRNNAASILIGFGEPAAPATTALARLLRDDKNADVRRHAALALGQIGPKAKASAPILSNAVAQDENPSVRAWSARSLAKVDDSRIEESVNGLVKLMAMGNGEADRINAIDGLGEIGARARKAAPQLKSASEVSRAANRALRRVNPGQ